MGPAAVSRPAADPVAVDAGPPARRATGRAAGERGAQAASETEVVAPGGEVGPWRCRTAADQPWVPVPVPGSWEQVGIPLDFSGPVEYKALLTVPPGAADRRFWLRFGAVSYDCVVYLDGREIGRHTGMWDPFTIEVTGLVTPGTSSDLTVRINKPASLTAGPDSPPVPGAYPLRETLAGFLPYVWGHSHGGIWQPVRLLVTGAHAFGDVDAWGDAVGTLHVHAELCTPDGAAGCVSLTVLDYDGRTVATRDGIGTDAVDFEVSVPDPRPWSPADPALYTVLLRVADGDERTLRVGLRTLSVDGSLLRLNEQPLYPRMVLSWGWYPDRLHPDPGPRQVRADLTALREMGFNGVKLCLWFPPPYYFDIADDLGMLLWLELPMWLPQPTAHFRRQLFTESRRLVRAAANHPSVILYTLGCELNAAIGAEILGPLYRSVKQLIHDGLLRDNSGSGEAYGGLLDEFADFDDHHFYCEPAHFRQVLDHFASQWRDRRPWLFGEFCDLDTFRDLRRLNGVDGGDRPWWTSTDPATNPQGARWQYDVPELEQRLRGNGFWERGAQLEHISHRQAVLQRKVILETVRSRPDTSGYVVTGERDTPISTAGLWDDTGRLKVDPAEFAAFNSDVVVTLGWDRRRAWLAGGDRPAPWDTWCHLGGAAVRAHLVLANHGTETAVDGADWELFFAGSAPIAQGHVDGTVPPGTVGRLGVAQFTAPDLAAPRCATLRVRVRYGGRSTENRWPLWFLPPQPWADAGPITLVDPAGRLADLVALAPEVTQAGPTARPGAGTVAVATAWTPALDAFVADGGSAVLLVDEHSGIGHGEPPVGLEALPFWRESVKVIEPHEAWDDFPHDGWVDLQFAGMATDLALDTAALPGARPLLRRVDNRTGQLHDYATEVRHGFGRLILSTLRVEGSRGDQPLGLRRNTGAAYLLSRWVRALRR